MQNSDAVEQLVAVAHTFGREPARRKSRLLASLESVERLAARDLSKLHAVLCFLRAYPDTAEVLRRVDRVAARLREWVEALPGEGPPAALTDSGVPGATHHHPYSYAVLERLLRSVPDCVDIDWDEFEDETSLHLALVLVVTNSECLGLDDITLTTAAWVARCKSTGATDLEFLLGLFAGSHLGFQEKAQLWDGCAIPIRYDLARPGTGRCEITWPCDRVRYQRTDIPRDRVPLEREMRRGFDNAGLLPVATGKQLVETALRALCSRNLEISSLMYANPKDATVLDVGRGFQVALIGVIPDYRDALEITYFHMIIKNGVPIAYGPASVCQGCCEMGVNLFPEYRGAEIRFIYAQFMRVLHQVLGARYFYLTSYGMGEGNPEAIRTGAFWFYRKLGFRASNPAVEALARAEEERMRQEPGYRCSVGMLRRLSHTDAFFDVSGGACERLDLGALGIRQSRLFADRFGGDRRRGVEHCLRAATRVLEIADLTRWTPSQRRALKILAPALCMIPDLAQWSAGDRRRVVRFIRAKGGRSEMSVDRKMFEHQRWRAALRGLASR